MRELPILFSAPMVKAILKARKSQTRRILKVDSPEARALLINMWAGARVEECKQELIRCNCPYGQPGDLLYVRESHYRYGSWMKDGTTKTGKRAWRFVPDAQFGKEVRFADNKPAVVELPGTRSIGWHKRSSLFLPKEYSRIWLQVGGIGIEHLQEISATDAIAEGIDSARIKGGPMYMDYTADQTKSDNFIKSPVESFTTLWISINGFDSWEENPWLWVVKFKVLSTTGRPAIAEQEAASV